jgi:hypothetical protein
VCLVAKGRWDKVNIFSNPMDDVTAHEREQHVERARIADKLGLLQVERERRLEMERPPPSPPPNRIVYDESGHKQGVSGCEHARGNRALPQLKEAPDSQQKQGSGGASEGSPLPAARQAAHLSKTWRNFLAPTQPSNWLPPPDSPMRVARNPRYLHRFLSSLPFSSVGGSAPASRLHARTVSCSHALMERERSNWSRAAGTSPLSVAPESLLSSPLAASRRRTSPLPSERSASHR